MRFPRFPLGLALILFSTATAAAQSLSPLESGILHVLNRVRSDPAAYAASLREQRRYYRGDLFTLPGQISIQTQEGVRALDEAVAALRSFRNPLGALSASHGLTRSAAEHARDTGARGLLGHQGSGGSTLAQRISRFGEWSGGIGEDISYGEADPQAVVSQLLIDDGVPGRGHRKSLLDPNWRLIGIACGPHATYRHMCVLDLAVGYREK